MKIIPLRVNLSCPKAGITRLNLNNPCLSSYEQSYPELSLCRSFSLGPFERVEIERVPCSIHLFLYDLAVGGKLLYATKNTINSVSINSTKASANPLIVDKNQEIITHVVALSKSKRVFWVQDSADGPTSLAIRSSSLNGTGSKSTIQSGFTDHIGGISIDWMSENIYWSQQKLQRIEVSRLDGSHKKVLVDLADRAGAEINKVLVDPIQG